MRRRSGQPIIDPPDDFSAQQDMNHLEEADRIKRDSGRMGNIKAYAKGQVAKHTKHLEQYHASTGEPEADLERGFRKVG